MPQEFDLPDHGVVDIACVVGNRPEIIKMSELSKALSKKYSSILLYTGQHFSANMRDVFLKDFGVQFDHDLACGTSDVKTLAKSIIRFFETNVKPRYVAVYGDTSSTVAGSLAAKKVGAKLIHIEAGLRSFNKFFIEERNRVFVDSVSDHLLAPTEMHRVFLAYEKILDEIYVTGNLIVDVCRKYAAETNGRSSLYLNLPADRKYILLTLHRPSSVDMKSSLVVLSKLLQQVRHTIVFPAHPRTLKNVEKFGVEFPENVIMMDAVGYKEFISLLKNSMLVMTDSGGVQEEAAVLGIPCITLTSTNDRQETILVGANRLYYPWMQEDSINDAIKEMLQVEQITNPYGENVTQRAMEAFRKIMG